MSTKYFALLTQLGADKLANAAALGTKIEITHMAVGDGGGSLPTPDTKQTKLINEKRRAAINTLSIDPKNTNQIISEQVIPESEGGWWIREIGLFDKDGILIAVGNCAESYKPQLQEGSGRTQTIRMILIVSSTESVTLKVDPSVVLATREYVDDSIQKHSNSRNHPDATLKEKGFVILSSAVDSNSETHAATPKAVKAAYDFANAANNNANGRVPSGRKVNGKALSEDIHLKASDVDAYNKTETDARVNDAKAQAKAANDNADGRVPAGRKVNGKALNADIALNSGDVGAYSKGETDTRVNEAKVLANTANQNAANANNNANTRLEKNQNGADIPNKPKFVENLGLTETKKQAENALSKSANGADIQNKPAFARNLGLSDAAYRSVGTGSNQIPDISSFGHWDNVNSGWDILPNGLVHQYGVAFLPPAGDYNRKIIGGVTYYTHFYRIAFPRAYPNRQISTVATLVSSSIAVQTSMAGKSVSVHRDTDSSGDAVSRHYFSVAFTTTDIGESPVIHWYSVGV
ncbi:hypothetical protein XBO1_1240080 [Xenorhabdus bovienii str. oregonense]|uniref:Phage tail fibre protein N-terminal domain-containing protein n=1 Tax=Xenorhabdus bovienii str. oregonense TaxID=1398202 RepID=A0A077P0S8_XENBV|nr:phage tail protein [Xenorhabdus bovienii]CDH04379.1 hypothetical protein XBO1_1240080 [Xenorhabdus bovienii str. oregonense]